MNGVTILNTIPWEPNFLAGCILILLGIVSFCLLVVTFKNEFIGLSILCLFLITTLVFSSIGCFTNFGDHRDVYQVTIDDSISFNEIQENYDVIDQNGVIYTVKEKAE